MTCLVVLDVLVLVLVLVVQQMPRWLCDGVCVGVYAWSSQGELFRVRLMSLKTLTFGLHALLGNVERPQEEHLEVRQCVLVWVGCGCEWSGVRGVDVGCWYAGRI
jgi:hypothetical protein